MKSILKSKIAGAVLAIAILSSNSAYGWNMPWIKETPSKFKTMATATKDLITSKYDNCVNSIDLAREKSLGFLKSNYNNALDLVKQKSYNWFTSPIQYIKNINTPNISEKIEALNKLQLDSNPGIINIKQEAICQKDFSNSIGKLANSIKSTWYKTPTMYEKISVNGIKKLKHISYLDAKALEEFKIYKTFKKCIAGIPTEKLSLTSKQLASHPALMELLKTKFELTKTLFQSFLNIIAPDNALAQSTITWVILLVGVPCTAYGIFKLVKFIVTLMPTIIKYTYNATKVSTIFIAKMLFIVGKYMGRKALIEIPSGIFAWLSRHPLVAMNVLIWSIIVNNINTTL
ncbi:MAG: hypothetical protein SZ59_C0001G0125 [candidate division TM6 bacterium GW2011_GWF2_28_16]|nr:MAG: hypothetical protein SZ59_C0001G0125 [candidate division TM6 bacterium GW2011_GWF2_28_16]